MFKKGKLYWFELDCPQLDDMFFVRLLRKIGLNYIPLKVKGASKVFLREDKTSYSRKLIDKCRQWGVRTYVIEEGARYAKNHLGHVPLYADYFVCLPEFKEFWVKYIPYGRLLTHEVIKKEFKTVAFLLPLYGREDLMHPNYWNKTNERVMRIIEKYKDDPSVAFKLHPKNRHLVEPLIMKERIIEGDAVELIKKYNVICFEDCSIRYDCQMVGKFPHIVCEAELLNNQC